MKFIEVNLNKNILKILEEIKFDEMTEIQEKTIFKLLNKQNLIVKSKTGSGKTAAYLIPLLHNLSISTNFNTKKNFKVDAIIIAPTRELIVQIKENIDIFSKYLNINSECIYGKKNIEQEKKLLNKDINILCATLGRLLQHIEEGSLKLENLKYLVIDEADKFFELGFYDQFNRLKYYISKKVNVMLFSATMNDRVYEVAYDLIESPNYLEIESNVKIADTIEQKYCYVNIEKKNIILYNIITQYLPDSVIVFCNTRKDVDKICQFLNVKKFKVAKIHGGMSQAIRLDIIKKFKNGEYKILISTDVSARGIHIEDLDMVINFDIPYNYDEYIHRVGRTGRCGNYGIALNIVSYGDLYNFYMIEEYIGTRIEEFYIDYVKVNSNVSLAREKYRYCHILEDYIDESYLENNIENKNYKNNRSIFFEIKKIFYFILKKLKGE